MVRTKMMILLVVCMVLVLSACSTGTRFVLPADTRVYLPAKDMTFAEGRAKSRPYFWSSFGSIDYQLLKNGEKIKEGKLESDFRVWSLFWPPFAIIYWPVGFEWNCYDLTGYEPTECYR
ncbi:MAG TPA: hypothetical protein VN604_03900 [Nitrospirota bacterium]|nr:hypothetical protein [Nitrospirota bacterium]